MSKVRRISSLAEVEQLEGAILGAADVAASNLAALLRESTSGIALLARMKFEKIAVDPLEARPLNLIEQVNQTFTYLASCDALRYLLDHHPEVTSLVVNLGTASGPDIASEDGSIVAEVFAATHPASNDKLRKDLKRLSDATAPFRYVFYACPGHDPGRVPDVPLYPGIAIVSVGCRTRAA